LIKYIKSVLWRVAKRLSYIQYARCLKVNELKTAITAFIRNVSQADLQNVFANKIKRVQAFIDARGHHFQTSTTSYKCTATFRTHCTFLLVHTYPARRLVCSYEKT